MERKGWAWYILDGWGDGRGFFYFGGEKWLGKWNDLFIGLFGNGMK